jgi:6-phosphogluconolactonase
MNKPSTKLKEHHLGWKVPTLEVFSTADRLFQRVAKDFSKIANQSVLETGKFIVALSGGTTPKRLYEILGTTRFRQLIPWKQTYVIWSDERHVPRTSPQSNFKMAWEALLSKVPVASNHILKMTDGKGSVAQKAIQYEKKMRKLLASQPMDLVLLGMGEDGHTASLFPGKQERLEAQKWVIGYFVDEEKRERISLTFPLLNQAKRIWVLIEGDKKSQMLAKVLEDSKRKYPIQHLNPTQGQLVFKVDVAAASQLRNKYFISK